MRSAGTGLFFNEVTRNGWLWGALALCATLLAVPPYLPPAAQLLNLAPLSEPMWTVVLACSLMPLVATQAIMAAVGRRHARAR
jgi:P-type Ca2+ transporter type 2C